MWGFRSRPVFPGTAQIKCFARFSHEGCSPAMLRSHCWGPTTSQAWLNMFPLSWMSRESLSQLWPCCLTLSPSAVPLSPTLSFSPNPFSSHISLLFHCASKIRSRVQSHNLWHCLDSSQLLCQRLDLQEYSWWLRHCPFPPLPHPSTTEQETCWLCISGKDDLFWDQPKEGEGQGLHGLALDCLIGRNLLLNSWGYFQLESSPEQVSSLPSPVLSRQVESHRSEYSQNENKIHTRNSKW